MKTFIFLLVFTCISFSASAQFGVSYHQSNLPFAGINYQIERFLPEFRVGTDNLFDDTGLELTISYLFLRKEMVDAYAGLGGRIELLEGIVVPVGVNIYPFEQKAFGFHIELAGIFGDDDLLRGSWGIRYRFLE